MKNRKLIIPDGQAPSSAEPSGPGDTFEGIVYYRNPLSGTLGLYLSFEYQPNRVYSVQITRDGDNYSELFKVDTKGNTAPIYESFNVPDPFSGIWPRVLDLGAST